MTYLVGVDGGGTKTAVIIASDKGEELTRFTVGPINYNGGDPDSISASFTEMFRQITLYCGHLQLVDHLCIGAAGISNPSVRSLLEQQARDCGYAGPLTITGDQETALYGAQNRLQGIILIAGTGSICFGVNEQGQQHRTGGFGHLIDDEGSGYSIGRYLLALLVQSADGRIKDTVVPELVYQQLGMTTVQEVIGFVYDKGTTKKDIARLAPILTTACEQGDAQALRLAEQSAASLYELIVPVIERLALGESPIAMAGSVLQKSRFVQEGLERRLALGYPQTRLMMPVKDAAYGAVILAKFKLWGK
ncbi:N-acetylglucosamine kinase [Paenibacillus sanguinis]|uniref:N-acetylglucosamine kinase n=1 Tax=Paenibacillus sanguinis TaxID=225906 RepID=UPI0003799952|nr:BadF/BadG/BcrA/BcrD ATPase family protein [Paenibacillus sanguinis]